MGERSQRIRDTMTQVNRKAANNEFLDSEPGLSRGAFEYKPPPRWKGFLSWAQRQWWWIIPTILLGIGCWMAADPASVQNGAAVSCFLAAFGFFGAGLLVKYVQNVPQASKPNIICPNTNCGYRGLGQIVKRNSSGDFLGLRVTGVTNKRFVICPRCGIQIREY